MPQVPRDGGMGAWRRRHADDAGRLQDNLQGEPRTSASLRWTARIQIDLGKWPNLKAYVDRVAARPKVQAAMKADGLMQ